MTDSQSRSGALWVDFPDESQGVWKALGAGTDFLNEPEMYWFDRDVLNLGVTVVSGVTQRVVNAATESEPAQYEEGVISKAIAGFDNQRYQGSPMWQELVHLVAERPDGFRAALFDYITHKTTHRFERDFIILKDGRVLLLDNSEFDLLARGAPGARYNPFYKRLLEIDFPAPDDVKAEIDKILDTSEKKPEQLRAILTKLISQSEISQNSIAVIVDGLPEDRVPIAKEALRQYFIELAFRFHIEKLRILIENGYRLPTAETLDARLLKIENEFPYPEIY